MWQTFVNWLISLFVKKKIETVVGETFGGWIKDDKDPRDQIFVGEK